jgi:hypothetical protein
MAAGERQRAFAGRRIKLLAGLLELRERVRREEVRRDHVQLDLLRASPERLVLVAEDLAHHVPFAAEIDVSHVGLFLEDRPHELDEAGVDVHHLLKLVQNQHHAPVAIGGDPTEHREELLERRIDVLVSGAGIETERHGAVIRIDGDRGREAQAGEDLQSLLRIPQTCGQILVDGPRQFGGELVLGRRPHQVNLSDEDVFPDQLLGHAPHERGLAVAPRGEDDDILSIARVSHQARNLRLAIGECVVQSQGSEPEGIDGLLRWHGVIMPQNIM